MLLSKMIPYQFAPMKTVQRRKLLRTPDLLFLNRSILRDTANLVN